MVIADSECPKCKEMAGWNKHCGCYVCQCGQHFSKSQILARCFCGWNVRDDVDRAEVGMNEDAKYLGDGEWEVEY